MTPLLRTALLRFLGFGLWIALSAWLFVLFEHTGRNERHEKYQLLRSLYESMASKYNMSIRDFNNLTSAAYEAMSEPGLEWTYHNALDFVIQASTTIGKKTNFVIKLSKYQTIFLPNLYVRKQAVTILFVLELGNIQPG